MNILKRKMQRREFLRNIGKAGLLVPFSSQFLMMNNAHALNGVAKRFVMVYYPNGVARGNDKFHQFNIGQLSSTSFGTSPLSQLADHADKVVAFKNLNFNGVGGSSGHPAACDELFGGGFGGTTFDVAMGESLGGLLKNNIHLGCWSSQVKDLSHSPFSDKNGEKIRVPDDPQAFYNNNLADLAGGGSGGSPEDDLRKRVLESLHENLDLLQQQTLNIPQTSKLQSHEEALLFYQNVLNSNITIGDGISAPNIGMNLINGEAEDVALAQMRNIAMSFQANITNTATYQFMGAQDDALQINFPSIRQYMGEFGQPDKLNFNETRSHVSSHAELPTFTSAAHWYTLMIKRLVDELSARDDAAYGGKIMDHTVILVMSEMGGGNHQTDNTGTFVVAGSDTGVNTGTGIDANGKTVANLFFDISNAFGRGWASYGKSDGGIPGFLV